MRFMMLVIPKGYEKAAADFAPPAELVARMTKYNDSLTKAGVLLGLDGLHPPATGARVRFAGGKPPGPRPSNGRSARPCRTVTSSRYAKCRRSRTFRPTSRRRRGGEPCDSFRS